MGPIANEEHTKMICKNIPRYTQIFTSHTLNICVSKIFIYSIFKGFRFVTPINSDKKDKASAPPTCSSSTSETSKPTSFNKLLLKLSILLK